MGEERLAAPRRAWPPPAPRQAAGGGGGGGGGRRYGDGGEGAARGVPPARRGCLRPSPTSAPPRPGAALRAATASSFHEHCRDLATLKTLPFLMMSTKVSGEGWANRDQLPAILSGLACSKGGPTSRMWSCCVTQECNCPVIDFISPKNLPGLRQVTANEHLPDPKPVYIKKGARGREPHFQGEVPVPEEREKGSCPSLCFPAMDQHQGLGKYCCEEKKSSSCIMGKMGNPRDIFWYIGKIYLHCLKILVSFCCKSTVT
ncbi:uncharacterized protein LOC119708473 [Motacilla alba alba]|uniref:uncharacterized protein LOC119708473 n=1 Tax=Motacilla alba alba TaxID=1094192 RepID=UPI0018D4E8B4|nr:uncharacterized protein LOC119708473 [Motacilla alba alba]